MRVCNVPTCPEITEHSRCVRHRAEAERARGTATERGYGTDHRRARAAWAPRVARGTVNCARCQQRIRPGETWHLDHNINRTGYLGPSHARCNLSAAGRASHGLRPR